MPTELLRGADAVVEAAIVAECRFFAGYPMSPFTAVLEAFAKRLPEVGGVCMNAASEIEGANMVLGAAAAGARAATGSCGQGISLMQETIAEGALNEVPFVVFNMARGQQDYFQSTRGGGWGDYRTITLAPKNVAEAVEHTQLVFHLADLHRSPTILYGDYLIADTNMSVDVSGRDFGPLPEKDWVMNAALNGTGKSRVIWTWDKGKVTNPGSQPDGQWRRLADKFDAMAEVEARYEATMCDDAETVVVSWGTSAAFVDYLVEEMRADGMKIGSFRPITLWPFPEAALAEATANCKRVLVYEVNAGQMLDDVRLSVADRSKIQFIGGVSVDFSGLRQGPLLQAPAIRDRILAAIQGG